jgi:hypothetical protein
MRAAAYAARSKRRYVGHRICPRRILRVMRTRGGQPQTAPLASLLSPIPLPSPSWRSPSSSIPHKPKPVDSTHARDRDEHRWLCSTAIKVDEMRLGDAALAACWPEARHELQLCIVLIDHVAIKKQSNLLAMLHLFHVISALRNQRS